MTVTEKQVRAFIDHLVEKENTFVKDEGEGCFTIDGCVNVSAALEAANGVLECAARRQGTAGGSDPIDCGWPACGCDPHADKVIEALQESGVIKAALPAPSIDAEREFLSSEARRYASLYPEASDGRNTFIVFAEMIERRSAGAS